MGFYHTSKIYKGLFKAFLCGIITCETMELIGILVINHIQYYLVLITLVNIDTISLSVQLN